MAIICQLCGVRKDATQPPYTCPRGDGYSPHYWGEQASMNEVTITGRVKKVAERRGAEGAWTGIGFGSAMAMVLSFELNHSIFWMIIHGVCSWFYVIYRAWQGNY